MALSGPPQRFSGYGLNIEIFFADNRRVEFNFVVDWVGMDPRLGVVGRHFQKILKKKLGDLFRRRRGCGPPGSWALLEQCGDSRCLDTQGVMYPVSGRRGFVLASWTVEWVPVGSGVAPVTDGAAETIDFGPAVRQARCALEASSVKRFSHWVTRGHCFDVGVKISTEPNGGI